MREQKRAARLEKDFGRRPDVEYFPEDLEGLRTYYDYRRERGMDDFYVDDTTWHDLSMDEVYKRMNAAQSSSGEQYLYYQLRTPALSQEDYEARRDLLSLVETDIPLRQSLQGVLEKLGKRRAANASQAFRPAFQSPLLYAATVLLSLLFFTSLAGAFFLPFFRAMLLLMVFINMGFHMYMMHRMEKEAATINYTVAMVKACRRMERLRHPALAALFPAFLEAGRRARAIDRAGGFSLSVSSDLATYINIVTLADLLAFERLKRLLSRHREDVFTIHEALGRMDAAIAVASYRKSAGPCCDPVIDFTQSAPAALCIQALRHPLVDGAVPNTLETETPLLITGSNASGKSTFLKGVLLNAILAQATATALADRYQATAFSLYSSMAIADNVLAGDSYFIAEIKSIRRIIEAAARGERVLCVIDEVLRGTNTVERIAASAELLAALCRENALCLAATHDGELCGLLPSFRQAHFEETLDDAGIHFDFQLKEGPATTRNAIRLLALLGFDEGLVERASARAEAFERTGRWESPQGDII